MIESVEGTDADGDDFCFIVFGFCEPKVMVPLKIEVGCGFCSQGIAAYSHWTSVAEASVEVVAAGDLVVGCAGVEARADA